MIRNLYITDVPMDYDTIEQLLGILGDEGEGDEGEIRSLLEDAEREGNTTDTFWYLDSTMEVPAEVVIDDTCEERYWTWAREHSCNFLVEMTWEAFLLEYSIAAYRQHFPGCQFKTIYD